MHAPSRRFVAIAGLCAILALAALLILAHTGPVRARVLAWTIDRIERAYGVEVRVERLDYNLARLAMRIGGVSVVRADGVGPPVFVADEVRLAIPGSALYGPLAIKDITLVRPRLTIVVEADGRTNLPDIPEGPGSAPIDSFRIDRASIEHLDLLWIDRRRDTRAELHDLNLRLTPAGDAIAGQLLFGEALPEIQIGDRRTSISTLRGNVSYDGSSLTVRDGRVVTPLASLDVNARISRLLNDPQVEGSLRAAVDLAASSPWLGLDPAATGTPSLVADIRGPLGAPTASLRLSGEHLSWQSMDDVAVAAGARLDSSAIVFERASLALAGGNVTGHGRIPFDEGQSRVEAEWADIDVSRLEFLSINGMRVGAMLDGSGEASWTALRLTALDARVDYRARARAVRGGVLVEGRGTFGATSGAWRAQLDHVVDSAIRVRAEADGRLSPDAAMDSTLTGRLEADSIDTARLAGLAASLAGSRIDGRIDGRIHGAFALDGTIRQPVMRGTIEGEALQLGNTGPGTVSARLALSDREARIESLDIAIGPNRLTAAGVAAFGGAVRGTFIGHLGAPADLLPNLSVRWTPTGTLEAEGEVSGTTAHPSIVATIRGHAIAIAGQSAERVSGTVTLENGTVETDDLELVQQEGRFGLRGRYRIADGHYSGKATGRRLRLDPLPAEEVGSAPVPLAGMIDLDFEGDGTLDNPQLSGQLRASSIRYGDYGVGSIESSVTLANQAVRADIQVPELSAGFRVRAALDAGRSFEVDGTITRGDLSRITQQTGAAHLAPRGVITTGILATGSLDRPNEAIVELDLRELDGSLGEAQIQLTSPGRLGYAGRRLSAEGVQLRTGETTIRAAGRMGADSSNSLQVSLDGDLKDLLPFIQIAGAMNPQDERTLALAGPVSAKAGVWGTIDGPFADAELRLSDASIARSDLPAVTDLTVAARLQGAVLAVDRVRLVWQDAILDGAGQMPVAAFAEYLPEGFLAGLPAHAQPGYFRGSIDPLTPALLAPFLDPGQLAGIEGSATASIDLQFDSMRLEDLQGEVRLDRAAFTAAGVPVRQRRPSRIMFAQGRARIDDWAWGDDTNEITASGSIELGGERSIALDLSGSIDLRLVGAVVPDVATGGHAQLTARARGTASSPRLDGEIELTDGEFRVADPRLAVTGLSGRITLTPDRIFTPSLTGSANGGALEMSMDFRYGQGAIVSGSLKATSSGVALELPRGLRSEIEADLTLETRGDGWTIGGQATVVRGAYRDPLSITAQLLDTLNARRATTRPGAAPSALDAVRLDIRVETKEDIYVDNNYGRLSLGTDVRLIGTIGQPALAGRATIREGGQIFLSGTVYRIESGAIDFTNPSTIEPQLDIRAQARVRQYNITLNLTGTPDALTSDLSSDDPQLGQSDLVSLLVTGRTLDEAGSAGAEVAQDQVLGYLTGEFFGSAGREVGLDVVRLERGSGAEDLRFDPGLVASETDPGTRLTVGKNIGRGVEVIFSQSLRSSADFTWILDYAPRNNLSLRGVLQDDRDRSYEFRHDVTFGGGRGAAESGRRASPQIGERVAAVRITGSPGFPEPELVQRLSLEAGDRFDFFEWQRDRERLLELYHERGYFEATVAARRAPSSEAAGSNEVTLEYGVDRGPLTALIVEGIELSGSVRRRMAEIWTRAILDDFLASELTLAVREELADRGYLAAAVSTTIRSAADGTTKEAVVRIEPGQLFTDARIEVTGNERIDVKRLQDVLHAERLVSSASLRPEALERAIAALYRSEGMLRATAAVGAPQFDGPTARLPVRIVEGPVFQVGRIAVEGATMRGDAAALEALGLTSGAVFSEALATAARQRLDASYRRSGFNAVKVAVRTEIVDATGTVDLAFLVTEGPQQVLRDIVIDGAEATNPGVVADALQLEPGETVDLAEWYRARKRLYDTNVFRRVDLRVEPIEGEPATAAVEPVRARVLLTEWPRYTLRYGLQLTEERPEGDTEGSDTTVTPGIAGDLQRRNLLGRAATAGISGRFERRQQIGRLFLTTPSLFGLPVTSALFLSRSRSEVPEEGSSFVTEGTDVTAEQRFRAWRNLRVSYGYNIQRNHTFDPNADPDDPFVVDVKFKVARLTATAVADTRDDLFDATRGWFHSSSVEYAAKGLGSDLRFAKYLAQQYYFRPLGRGVVFASAARIGVSDAFGQQLVPSERFTAGGGNSVRGYAENSLASVDVFGDPLGDALLVFNEELRFPLYRWLRGVTFFDAGRAFASALDLSILDLSTSIGAGLRVETPFVLLRADYGRPLGRKNTGGGRWFFSIGQMF